MFFPLNYDYINTTDKTGTERVTVSGYSPCEDLSMDASDDEWEDADDVMLLGPVKCLFCSDVLPSADDVFTHCDVQHQFDIVRAAQIWNLDCISYIKMINYIRLKVGYTYHCLD